MSGPLQVSKILLLLLLLLLLLRYINQSTKHVQDLPRCNGQILWIKFSDYADLFEYIPVSRLYS